MVRDVKIESDRAMREENGGTLNYEKVPNWVWAMVGLWVLNLIWSSQTLIPHSDDAPYFLPALGFAYTGEIAVHFGDETTRLFRIFPGYSFLLGLALRIRTVFDFDLNFYSYRFFHIAIFSGLLVAAVLLTRANASDTNSKSTNIRFFIFFLALGFSPMNRGALVDRPEFAGLLSLVIALVLFRTSTRRENVSHIPFFLAALSLGVGATMHPITGVMTGAAAIGMAAACFTRVRAGRTAAFLLVAALPVIAMGIYYVSHLPDSLVQMGNQMTMLPQGGNFFRSGSRLIEHAFLLGSGTSLAIRSSNAMFYLPFLLVLLTAFALAVRVFITQRERNPSTIAMSFVVFAAIPILFFERGLGYVHAAIALTMCLAIATLPSPKFLGTILDAINKRAAFAVAAIVLVVSASLWNLTHIAKFALFPGEFLQPRAFLSALNTTANNIDAIFVVRSELAPFVLSNFDAQYRSRVEGVPQTVPETTYFTHLLSNLGNQKGIDTARSIIFGRMDRWQPERTLWLVAKKNLREIPGENNYCMTLGDGFGRELGISVRLTVEEIIYESNKHLAIRPSAYSNQCNQL
jgi:hypothetical protein